MKLSNYIEIGMDIGGYLFFNFFKTIIDLQPMNNNNNNLINYMTHFI